MLPLGYVQRKGTVELEGTFEDGFFRARRIEVEEPDEEVTIKGVLSEWRPPQGGAVGGVSFRLDDHSRFVDEDGRPVAPDALQSGMWVKVECAGKAGALRVRKIQMRSRKPDEAEELQGEITAVDRRGGTLEIRGIPVRFPPDVLVVWDVKGQPPPTQEEMESLTIERTSRGLRRVKRRDDDDRRPEDQLVIGDVITVGGEIQYDMEWRGNHDLKAFQKRDRLIHQLSARLEFSFDLAPNLFAFAQVRVSRKFVHFDQNRDLDFDTKVKLGEAYFLFQDLPLPGIGLQVGRQDVDYLREWVVDDNLDAVRLWVNLDWPDVDVALLDLSISRDLFDEGRDRGITNFLTSLYLEPDKDTELYFYYMHREGGRERQDLSRDHLGFSGKGEFDDLTWWLDVGLVAGQEDHQDVFGYGFDAVLMYEFGDLAGKPYLVGGFAYGSGDKNPDEGTDNSFRQTGLNDNNDRFGGVTSFRYLGELVRPEVSNLMIFTAGIGFRPTRRSSVDLVFHHYRQVEAVPFLRDTRLRRAPSGESRDIGNALDLIIGIEDFRPVEMEIVFSYFHPGAAFTVSADDAWFATVQIEYNF